jgi:hypothetical protein
MITTTITVVSWWWFGGVAGCYVHTSMIRKQASIPKLDVNVICVVSMQAAWVLRGLIFCRQVRISGSPWEANLNLHIDELWRPRWKSHAGLISLPGKRHISLESRRRDVSARIFSASLCLPPTTSPLSLLYLYPHLSLREPQASSIMP